MKKHTLLLTVSFLWAGLNAQTEFAPTGAEWYYNCCANGNIINSHSNYIVSEKDTTVEGSSCRILRQYYDNSNTASEKYVIKQEQGKIYYHYQDRFNLLFDFGAEVNDTAEFTFMYKKYDDFPSSSYKDTILSARYRVESITTNAQNLKTFRTKILEEDKFAVYGMDVLPWDYSYTEKIGFYDEFMPMLDNTAHPSVDNFPMLRCYSDADFSFVSDAWTATSLPCDYSTASDINIAKDENRVIYPNPFNDNVFISTDEGEHIEIIDASGKVVCYSKLEKGINMLPTNQLLKGWFLAKIHNKDNSIQVFKIIKL
ncbi:MAG: T9SS type A sorting domain-containing protein [Prevotellaceae bacterium]|jgi:hypothetical protein|nr:T9SS type A sorting domain-containing protein [Prevotellaceae bacterium]